MINYFFLAETESFCSKSGNQYDAKSGKENKTKGIVVLKYALAQ